MSKPAQKDLMAAIKAAKLDEYGSFIPGEFVHSVLRITVPEVATREEFSRIALLEMAAVDYCRGQLINEGKYLKQERSGYRILLPGENAGQIESYMQSADNKLGRALKLSKNTPGASQNNCQTQERILMKMASKRR